MAAVIQTLPPRDGREWDCQCARCGSSCYSERCDECGGDGFIMDDENEGGGCEEFRTCPQCLGRPVRYRCLSSAEWCNANPLEGRDGVERGKIEWFVIEGGAQ